MKITKITSLLLLALALNSCSGDDAAPVDNSQAENPETEVPPTENPETPGAGMGIPMSAKIDGTLYNMASPWGDNLATASIYSYYPDEDYIQIQGRWGGVLGPIEINMWIKRTDLRVGTFNVNADTEFNTTHIDLINNLSAGDKLTTSGSISITEINTTTKVVKGTFAFEAKTYDEPVITYSVTDGKFNYRYDAQ
jgi:hypothetical protein